MNYLCYATRTLSGVLCPRRLRACQIALRKLWCVLSLPVLVVLSAPPVHAEEDLLEALTGGKVDLYLRYRFEHVADEAINPATGQKLKDANASTLRTALGYKTGAFYGVGLRLQVEDVREIWSGDFNNGNNGKTDFAAVIDPQGTEVNEGYIFFEGLTDTLIKGGRQEIFYRKPPFQRFIGNIPWRQNWQSFDAVSVVNESLADTRLSYAYVWQVNRIFGDEAPEPLSRFKGDTHFLNGRYTGLALGEVRGYTYLLDFDNAARFSTNTFGARFDGTYPVTEKSKALYALEYAHQFDTANNPENYDVGYFLGGIGATFGLPRYIETFTGKFNYELLQGQGGQKSFQTILGTNHAYQGWADRFLITPGDGVQDFYFTMVAKIFGANFIVVHHDFGSDNLGYDYGSEWDLALTRTFWKRFTFGLKYADYDADRNATNLTRNPNSAVTADVRKFWTLAVFNS